MSRLPHHTHSLTSSFSTFIFIACALFAAVASSLSAATLGQSLSLEATASGTKPFQFQWKKNGIPIVGAINSTFSIASLTTGDAGTYTVEISNSAGKATSDPIAITIDVPDTIPSILTQPATQTVPAGHTVVLAVQASGSKTFTYQWRRNGVNIAGATSPTLSLPNITLDSAGTYSVVVTNSKGSTTSLNAVLSVSGWVTRNLGVLTGTGTQSLAGGTLTMTSSSLGLVAASAGLTHSSQTVTGDFDLRARVATLTGGATTAEAGLAVYPSITSLGSLLSVGVNRSNAITLKSTNALGVPTTLVTQTGSVAQWLRLVRSGNYVRAYRSTDGVSWTNIGGTATSLPATVTVGPWISSGTLTATATATYSGLSLRTLPLPWISADINVATLIGSASFDGGAFTVAGSGTGIGSNSDSFRFMYTSATGDCEISARVVSMGYTDAMALAGVMIRESLSPSAVFINTNVTPTKSPGFMRRQWTGSFATAARGDPMSQTWVKAVRRGNIFESHISSDGQNWSLIHTQEIAMSSTALLGLAVSSRNTGVLCPAVFDNVVIKP